MASAVERTSWRGRSLPLVERTMIHTLLDFTQLGPPDTRTTCRGISFLPTSLPAITRKRGSACTAPEVTFGAVHALPRLRVIAGSEVGRKEIPLQVVLLSGGPNCVKSRSVWIMVRSTNGSERPRQLVLSTALAITEAAYLEARCVGAPTGC